MAVAPVSHRVVTEDGHALEAELAVATAPRLGMVLCHPHPAYGGTMRSIVISALFGELPALGISCLRFNFRGVEASEGTHDEGRGERLDALAAVGALDAVLDPTIPIALAGWSFGADVALATSISRLAAWYAIAPPLHYVPDPVPVARDERPKLLAVAEHDEVRSPAEIVAVVAGWANTEVEVVGGASHFFVGRTARLVELAGVLAARLGS